MDSRGLTSLTDQGQECLGGSEGLAVDTRLQEEWEKTFSSGGQQHTPWGLLVLFNPVDFRSCFQKNLVAYTQCKIYHLNHSCVQLIGITNIHIVVQLKWSRTI